MVRDSRNLFLTFCTSLAGSLHMVIQEPLSFHLMVPPLLKTSVSSLVSGQQTKEMWVEDGMAGVTWPRAGRGRPPTDPYPTGRTHPQDYTQHQQV